MTVPLWVALTGVLVMAAYHVAELHALLRRRMVDMERRHAAERAALVDHRHRVAALPWQTSTAYAAALADYQADLARHMQDAAIDVRGDR